MERSLLCVEDLHVTFPVTHGMLRAVRGVSLDIRPGEFFGIVGETGCGKSVSMLAVMRLLPPYAEIHARRITLKELDLLGVSEAEMRTVRGQQIGMIFQDPSASLNPLFTVGEQVKSVITAHLSLSQREARQRAIQLLNDVRLPDPASIYKSYPHQLSGGMQQRVMIAIALAAGPSLLIADEPTTALDVTIQAQILDLLLTLREEKGITIILITHNLGVVAEVCDRVVVFYAGQVVEQASVHDLFHRPLHPYTHALMAAVPKPGEEQQDLQVIPGFVPTGLHEVTGCPFTPRCPLSQDRCVEQKPELREVEPGHMVACHYAGES